MSNDCIAMTPPLNQYLRDLSLRESPILQSIREETAHLPEANMQISPEQGQYMALMLRLMDAKRVLEVGVFTGYSTLACALALPEKGQVVACDISKEWTDVARRYWEQAGMSDKIELHLRPAFETLNVLLDHGQAESFDFAFIDADKAGYAVYFDLCLALVRPGGLIAIDNVLWSGSVADANDQEPDTQAIRAFNERIKADERVDISMIPISDGLTLALKRAGA